MRRPRRSRQFAATGSSAGRGRSRTHFRRRSRQRSRPGAGRGTVPRRMPPTWWDLTAARSSSVRKAVPLHRNQERPASPTRKRTDLSIGLRPGEVCGLRWIDLDLEAGVVHVRQSLKHYDGKPVDSHGVPGLPTRRRAVDHRGRRADGSDAARGVSVHEGSHSRRLAPQLAPLGSSPIAAAVTARL
jgi:integrase